jgi:K+-sensing histidine kinase KdpD
MEIVETVKESVMVTSENLKVIQCNKALSLLFNSSVLLGCCLLDFMHTDDVRSFHDTTTVILASGPKEIFTIQFRIRTGTIPSNECSVNPAHANKDVAPDKQKLLKNKVKSSKVACDCDDISEVQGANNDVLAATKDYDYCWIECTMYKDMTLNADQDFDYTIKMVARDIDERKRLEQRQNQASRTDSEEKGLANAAKLRYISCIAHDLKTPLQSFSYSLDLLQHSKLLPEQLGFIDQANVAVDLMKLTISQTMDINKALTGAKLMPRRTTVSLTAVLNHVMIIM